MKISFCTRHPVRKRFTRLNVCQTFTRKIARSCHVLALMAPAVRLRAFLPARLIGQAGISTKI